MCDQQLSPCVRMCDCEAGVQKFAKPQISSCVFGNKHTILISVNGEKVAGDGLTDYLKTLMPKQNAADVRVNQKYLHFTLDM